MTEFALSVTAALTLLFAVMQVARVLYAYSWVSYAARAATRYAIVHGTNSSTPVQATASTNIKNLVSGLAASQLGAVTLNCPVSAVNDLCIVPTFSPNNKPGSTISVQVTYNFQYSIPLLTSQTLALTSTSKMVIAQ